MRVLLIENRLQPLRRALERKGFEVETAKDGKEADRMARAESFDVIVLDLETVSDAGVPLVKRWRSDGILSRIVVLTNLDGINGKIEVLSVGADDCIAKPIDVDDLSTRLQTLTPVSGAAGRSKAIVIFDLQIDTTERTVERAGLAIRLTPREFDLLHFLAQHRGKPVSRAKIRDHVYPAQKSRSNVVDVYVRYLRKKIDNGFDFPIILTCWGKGYMLRGEDKPPVDKA